MIRQLLPRRPSIIPDAGYFCTGSPNDADADWQRELGEVVSLILASPHYVRYRIATIGLWLLPAIRARQIKIFHDKRGRPVGYITWAFLTVGAEARWTTEAEAFFHPSEWNDGNRLWFVDMLSPHGYGPSIIRHCKMEMFPDITCAGWLRRNYDGSIRSVKRYNRTVT